MVHGLFDDSHKWLIWQDPIYVSLKDMDFDVTESHLSKTMCGNVKVEQNL